MLILNFVVISFPPLALSTIKYLFITILQLRVMNTAPKMFSHCNSDHLPRLIFLIQGPVLVRLSRNGGNKPYWMPIKTFATMGVPVNIGEFKVTHYNSILQLSIICLHWHSRVSCWVLGELSYNPIVVFVSYSSILPTLPHWVSSSGYSRVPQ